MKKYILAVAAGLVLAGNSFAAQPLVLTDVEMDNVSAGLSVVAIGQAGLSLGNAATAGSSTVVGVSINGFDAAAGVGNTAGASGPGAGFWATRNVVAAN